jgi:LPS-assembly lipoprotein
MSSSKPSAWRAGRRRAATWLCLASLACLGLGACGFALRGTQQLPYPTIALVVPANSPLASELARSIRTGTHTRVVSDPAQAAAIFDLLAEVRGEHVNALVNAQGRTTDYTLRFRLRFRLRDAQGREVIESTELQAQRDISFNDSQRLSKESEEALLIRDMQSDLVQQVLRRIAAAKPYAASD